MKTAESIAQQQEMQRDGENVSKQTQSESCDQHPKQQDYAWLKPYQWEKGQSGNPSGRPKRDKAAEFARSLFDIPEEDLERYRLAFVKQLLKGNAYVFKELAERGYGKLPQALQHTGEDGGPIDTSIKVMFVNPDATSS